MRNNLIKSILEENILSFKEESNTLLYSKLNSKLKQKYIGISKSLFGSINESSVWLPPDLFYQAGVVGGGGGGGGDKPPPPPPPRDGPSGGEEELADFPADYPMNFNPNGDKPSICNYLPPPCDKGPNNPYPKGSAAWKEYEKRKQLFLQHIKSYFQLVKAWDSYYRALKRWQQKKEDGRRDPGPRPVEPKNGPPGDYSPPRDTLTLRPERFGEYA